MGDGVYSYPRVREWLGHRRIAEVVPSAFSLEVLQTHATLLYITPRSGKSPTY